MISEFGADYWLIYEQLVSFMDTEVASYRRALRRRVSGLSTPRSGDDPLLQKFREYARRLKEKIKPLRTYSVNAVSFVSADGGDNRLVFNPAGDSRGNQCVLDAIPIRAALVWLRLKGAPSLERRKASARCTGSALT